MTRQVSSSSFNTSYMFCLLSAMAPSGGRRFLAQSSLSTNQIAAAALGDVLMMAHKSLPCNYPQQQFIPVNVLLSIQMDSDIKILAHRTTLHTAETENGFHIRRRAVPPPPKRIPIQPRYLYVFTRCLSLIYVMIPPTSLNWLANHRHVPWHCWTN